MKIAQTRAFTSIPLRVGGNVPPRAELLAQVDFAADDFPAAGERSAWAGGAGRGCVVCKTDEYEQPMHDVKEHTLHAWRRHFFFQNDGAVEIDNRDTRPFAIVLLVVL